MAGKKGQKKRFWSDEEKRSICGQTCASGVSVAQVARRYLMNANLIHKWMRDPRFAPYPSDEFGQSTDATFAQGQRPLRQFYGNHPHRFIPNNAKNM